MAKSDVEKTLKEILGENGTLGADSAEEDWSSDGNDQEEASGLNSWE